MPIKDKQKRLEYSRKWKREHKEQLTEYMRQYRESHRDEVSAYSKNYEKAYRNKRKSLYIEHKNKFFEMYGNKCTCCGEGLIEFLTLEHKLGQVGKKKESWAYRKAIQEYRPDLYETLCMNCNFSKGKYGYCPHQV